MGYWGLKSYENDDASDALDAGYERVHGDAYDDLMDDRNGLTFDQVQQRLGSPETLAAAVEALRAAVAEAEAAGYDGEGPAALAAWEDFDDEDRLAFAGVVVRHAEFGVPVPADWRDRAVAWLEAEELDWETEATVRRLRRQKEVAVLKDAAVAEAP